MQRILIKFCIFACARSFPLLEYFKDKTALLFPRLTSHPPRFRHDTPPRALDLCVTPLHGRRPRRACPRASWSAPTGAQKAIRTKLATHKPYEFSCQGGL